ncbi:hypothetical protein SRB5_38190 [Streptomyces sp. RB5]|uniref:Tetratricopeptide repeat protein n=1 Tax=Streptomyces smaragdinus TaxID=2585196 RepID=A0A7K0CJK6_9ACTN|nr:FxSxx-COOH system tetratricopeptide repeat protein [Streptomyces smaragdinus]MQY13669.1 hypothetical protein [Streptomyces smaragdinus]
MRGAERPGRTLAVLLSVAARIEPELMRAVRITAAPGLDVAAEVDLWFGDLVEHRGYGYVELRADVLEPLRDTLRTRLREASDEDPIHRLWSVYQRVRSGQSPALRAQEYATWLDVSGGPEASELIEETLQPALRALMTEDREGVARWFTTAWDRLPDRVRRSTAAWQLMTLSSHRLAGEQPRLPRPARLALADVVAIAGNLPLARLHIRWSGDRLLMGDASLEPGEFAISVPDTDPRVVELMTGDTVRTVLIGRDMLVQEWVGPGPHRLVSADGAVYMLPPQPDVQPDTPPGVVLRLPSGDLSVATSEKVPTGPSSVHISICYSGESRPWAMWTAHQLEAAGCATTLLRWDTASRTPQESLGSLLAAPGQVLLLLNERALRPDLHQGSAWSAALRAIVDPNRERFAALVLSPRSLPEAVTLLEPVDVAGLEEEEARRLVLERLAVPVCEPPEQPDGPRFPNDPPQVREAPRRNTHFTGRKDDLEELSELLAEPGQTGARVVLTGISGVGKTQMASEYAYRYGDSYDVVWWIYAGERSTAREQFAALAVHLELAAGRDVGERIRAVHTALRARTTPRQRWLLIFDGADDVEEIRDLLPEGRGDVLVTSLTRDWAGVLGFQEYTLRVYTRAESVAFIHRRVPRATSVEAEYLAESVQDLPLVLAQTTAWLAANPEQSISEYVDMLLRLSPEELAVRVEDDYPHAFATSWALLLGSLRERNADAADLIELMTMFSPDAIPLRLIAAAPAAVLPPGSIARTVADSATWQKALAELANLTAIDLRYSQDPSLEHTVESAQMHRLYHRFIRGNLSHDTRLSLSAAACGVLAAANPGHPADQREWPVYRQIIPHLSVAGVLDRDEHGVRELLLDCVDNLRLRGEYDTGLRLCQQAVARWRPRYPGTDGDMLVLVHQHANLLRRMGRYRDAEAVGVAVVDLLAGARDPADPDLLRAKDGLGGTLMALGQFARSRELFHEVWRGHASRAGDHTPRALNARSNMAVTLGLLGHYRESLDIHRELYELRVRQLGDDNFQTLYSGLCAAWMTRLLGRYAEALDLQQRNARLHRRALGRNHPQTLSAEHNLAQCLRRDGRVEDAADLFRGVLKRSRQVQGPLHPDTLMMAADQATLLRAESPREAYKLARDVSDGYLRLLGPDHPYAAGSLGNLALAQWASGVERDESGTAARTAWQLMTRAVGEEHPWTLGCRLNHASMLALNGDVGGAVDHDKALREVASERLGPQHPLALVAATAYAWDLRRLGRAHEAEELHQQTMTDLRDTIGAQHPHTLSAGQQGRPYWDFEPQPI